MTGMGRTLVVDEMVQVERHNHGTAPPFREPKYRPLHYGRAGRLPHSRRGAAFQPRCSMGKGGWTHGRRYAQGGTRRRHAVSHQRIKLSSALAARGTALRPPPARNTFLYYSVYTAQHMYVYGTAGWSHLISCRGPLGFGKHVARRKVSKGGARSASGGIVIRSRM